MIYKGTVVKVIDNSNVKLAKCIEILNKRGFAKIGDKLIVSIKSTLSCSKINRGDIYNAVVMRTKKSLCRKNKNIIKFFDNSVILLDKDNNIIGSRIFGVIPREIRLFYKNLISLSKNII